MLIDEIEEAAKRCERRPYSPAPDDETAFELRQSIYWPRIRAALLAAEIMREIPFVDSTWAERFAVARLKFIEAIGE